MYLAESTGAVTQKSGWPPVKGGVHVSTLQSENTLDPWNRQERIPAVTQHSASTSREVVPTTKFESCSSLKDSDSLTLHAEAAAEIDTASRILHHLASIGESKSRCDYAQQLTRIARETQQRVAANVPPLSLLGALVDELSRLRTMTMDRCHLYREWLALQKAVFPNGAYPPTPERFVLAAEPYEPEVVSSDAARQAQLRQQRVRDA